MPATYHFKGPCLWNVALIDKPTESVTCTPDDIVQAVRAVPDQRREEARAWAAEKRAREEAAKAPAGTAKTAKTAGAAVGGSASASHQWVSLEPGKKARTT